MDCSRSPTTSTPRNDTSHDSAAGRCGSSRSASSSAIGDQEDRTFLESLGPMDILIDDGGHHVAQQVATFEACWPLLADGGVYICEDAHTSYWSKYGPGSFVEVMKDRVDDMHRWFSGEPNDYTRTIQSVHFYPAMVVVEKACVEEPEYISNDGTGVRRSPFMREDEGI